MAKKTGKHEQEQEQSSEVINEQKQTEAEAQTTEMEEELQSLTIQLQETEQKQVDAIRAAQRAQADYINLKKRFEKEREEIASFASEALFMRLLPVVDNLDRAVFYATKEESQSSLYQGVKMTLQQAHDMLESVGIRQLLAKPGEGFDPHQHEAVEMVNGEQSKIVEVVQPGYVLKDKVIRPVQVKVGNGEAAE